MPRRTDEHRPGRPRLDPNDESVPVHVKLPSRQYDQLYNASRRERCSMPELVRRALHLAALVDDETE